MPERRFPEFEADGCWQKSEIRSHLTESRLKGNNGDVAKKITVKLWGKGVFEKQEARPGSPNTQYYRRKAGQFIYSKLDFLNQGFGIIPRHLDGYETTVDLPCFDVKKSLDVRFLLEYVKREDFYTKYGEMADGGRKAKRIQAETFMSLPIYLPKPREQQKVADCLASIDQLITSHSQKLDDLKAHKKGLIQQLFPTEGETQPKLRFPEFQGGKAWHVGTLNSISSVSSGGTPSRSKPEYWNGDIPWVSTTLVDFNIIESVNEYITKLGLQNSSAKIYPKGTILMAMYGQGKTRGQVAILGLPAAINQACGAITLNEGMNTGFVYQNLASRYEQIRQMANEGGQANLSAKLINEIPFFYPDPESGEQQKIANCLASIDKLITAEAQKIDALKTHKKGLVQQLFPALDDNFEVAT